MKSLIFFIVVVIAGMATNVYAGNINEREAAQRDSIRAGVEDGSLTGHEARRLRNQQVKLERKEQRFRSDGELTRRERANLHTTLDANRARIYRQRHDDQIQEQ